MTRLILWRHGQTAWNAAGRIQGHTDVDLDATGRAQAEAAARILAQTRPEYLVSSDLRRAYDTAATLGRLVGLEVHTDKRLRERGYGAWEGLTRVEVAAKYPISWQQWLEGRPLQDHDIESHDDVGLRVSAAIADAVDTRNGTVIVVTHGGAARRVLDTLTGIPGFSEGIGGLGNCCWADVRRRGDSWRVHAYNVGEPTGQL